MQEMLLRCGYALPKYGSDDDETQEDEAPQPVGTLEITGGRVYVRGGPGTRYDPVTVVSRGTRLPVLGESGGWHCVGVNGKSGWVGAASNARPDRRIMQIRSACRGICALRCADVERICKMRMMLLTKWGAYGTISYVASRYGGYGSVG